MKKGLVLDKVVLLGRTFKEYALYLGLDVEEWRGKRILDIASGVSSFCAEAADHGLDVTAVDPIYDWSSETIRERCEPDLDLVTRHIEGLSVYRWHFYKSPEGMRQYRARAYQKFLEDYSTGKGTRYVAGRLPHLPVPDASVDLAIISYLLFLYEDQLGYEFHRRAVQELMRVSRKEARIYPLVNFEAERSKFVDKLMNDPELAGYQFEEMKVDFEFLANSNSCLRIMKRSK